MEKYGKENGTEGLRSLQRKFVKWRVVIERGDCRYKKVSSTSFGLIKYFLNIESAFYVALVDLDIISNITKGILGRSNTVITDLKHQGVFDQYYSEVKMSNRFLLINPKEIICKCLVFQLPNGNLHLSQFDIETDYI